MTFLTNIKTAQDLERERIELEAARARSMRDAKLKELDNLVMNPLRWAEFSQIEKELLSQYRNSLLDLTKQDGFPFDAEWPILPDAMTK